MITGKLIKQVKRKLNITWEDEDTNERVNEILASAIPDIIHMLGIPDEDFDFSEAGIENTLLLSYCLYEWEHSLDEFEDNYSKKIATARAKWEVEAYKLENGVD